MRNNLRTVLISMTMCLAFFGASPATAAQRTQQTHPPKAPREPVETTDLNRTNNESEQAMKLAMTDLANQIGLLTDEVRRLRQQTSRNSTMMELLISEERLARVEEKIQDESDRKAQLDAREQDLQRRLRNIQQELVFRGAIRRDEAEAAIRLEIQRSLDDVHSQQSVHQQRATELQAQADRLKSRVGALRKKVETAEEKDPKEEKRDN